MLVHRWIMFMFLASSAVRAEDLFVNPADVEGLIAAIERANSNGQRDTIHLATESVYTLSEAFDFNIGLPLILSDIEIFGNGATIEREIGNLVPKFQIFNVNQTGQLMLHDLELRNASGRCCFGGGAISVLGGRLVLNNCRILRNTADMIGGAIYVRDAEVEIVDSLLSQNTATRSGDSGSGGAIFVRRGVVTITRSVITRNAAISSGGAIFIDSGSVSLIDCVVTRNAAAGGGGMFIHVEGVLELVGSTVADNHATRFSGGGIENRGQVSAQNCTFSGNGGAELGGGAYHILGSMNFDSCTFSNNSANAGGGTFAELGGLAARNSIFANSTGGDTQGDFIDLGHNLVEDGSGIADPTSLDGDPNLGPLDDNGGLTRTHALLPGSIAIDAGSCADGKVNDDQRGVSRPQGSSCDVGAFEVEGGACPADIDGDGDADAEDFFGYLDAFASAEIGVCDIDGDGDCDASDFFLYLDRFSLGC